MRRRPAILDGIVVPCDAPLPELVAHLASAHDQVLNLTGAPDPQTRRTALAALCFLCLPSDFDLVLQRLRVDSANAVRDEAARTLAAHPYASTWRTRFDIWLTSPTPRYRVRAHTLAAQFDDQAAMRALQAP